MKTAGTALTTTALALTALPAFAAGGRVDHSGVLVWGFLGMCAMIVVAQLVPAVLMVVGMVKGLTTKAQPEAEKVTVK